MTRDTNEPIKPWKPPGSTHERNENKGEELLMSRRDAVFALQMLIAIQQLQERRGDISLAEFPQFSQDRIINFLNNKYKTNPHDILDMKFVLNASSELLNKYGELGYEWDYVTGGILTGQLSALKTAGAETDIINFWQVIPRNKLGSDAHKIVDLIAQGKLTIHDVRKE